MSSALLLLQIVLISTFLFRTLNKSDTKEDLSLELTKLLTYILAVVNFIFILMIHITLVFFSTDERGIVEFIN